MLVHRIEKFPFIGCLSWKNRFSKKKKKKVGKIECIEN